MLPLRPAAIDANHRAPEPKPATTARDEVAFAANKPVAEGQKPEHASIVVTCPPLSGLSLGGGSQLSLGR